MSDLTLTLKIDNTYGHGTITTRPTAVVPRPEDLDDLEEWFEEYIFEHTGTGADPNEYAIYEAEIVACDELPALVGKSHEWGG
jgi:hypothetical protein